MILKGLRQRLNKILTLRKNEELRLFLTGEIQFGAQIEILKGNYVAATLKPKRCKPRILSLLLTNINYLYYNSRPSLGGLMRILLSEQLLLIRRNPRLFFSELFRCYSIFIPGALLNGEQLTIRIQNSDSNIWISRSVIDLNFKSMHFGHEIERRRARGSKDINVFVWHLDRKSRFKNLPIKSLLNVIQLDEIEVVDVKQSLGIHTLKDVKIIGGEFAVQGKKAFTAQSRSALESVSWPTEKIFSLGDGRLAYCFGKSGSAPRDSEFIFAGSNPNWFHFLSEVLPLILGLEPRNYQGKRVVLSNGHPNQILEICTTLTGRAPYVIEHGDSIHFPELIFVADNRYGAEFDARERQEDLMLVPKELSRIFPLDSRDTPRRFVIKRPPSSFRRCGNIDEVHSLLIENGFCVVQTELLTAQEQLDLFRSAEFVVAESGAALTTTMFLPKNARVLEIQPPGSESDFWPEFFELFEFKYKSLKGKKKSPLEKIFSWRSDYVVDLNELQEAIETP